MKLHRYVDHQRLHIVTKDVISLSISVLLLFRHYISHKITFGAPSSGGVLCSACSAFILLFSACIRYICYITSFQACLCTCAGWIGLSLGSSLIILSSFFFSVSGAKLIEINPFDVVSFYSLSF